MNWETAKQLLLVRKRIRQKSWMVGVYIYAKKSKILPGDALLPGKNFIFLGGRKGIDPTEWSPYLEDFFVDDWEVIPTKHRGVV